MTIRKMRRDEVIRVCRDVIDYYDGIENVLDEFGLGPEHALHALVQRGDIMLQELLPMVPLDFYDDGDDEEW